MYDILIVGGGPAGLTAALYARRHGKNVLLLEKEGFGGQIAFAPRVENYPGVPAAPGAEIAQSMLEQILALDTETDIGTVCALERAGDRWLVRTEEGETYESRAVIVAAGAKHRPLGVEGEFDLLGSGVSYCAVCDGSFYQGEDVAVVGGGDSALQEALLLADICRTVYVIHRRESFKGDEEKQKRLFARDNVKVVTPCEVAGFLTEGGSLRGVTLRDKRDGSERELPLAALFISVGVVPQIDAFAEWLPLDEKGYAALPEGGASGHPGLFVAGDCRKKEVRQLTTAVSDGANAALAACRYLDT